MSRQHANSLPEGKKDQEFKKKPDLAIDFDILARAGTEKKEPASEVFSRFLNYLRYLELTNSNQPLPEMSWFVVN